ncbi:GNAT family N-acetyltransferase, partial [bacterium]|nr:GNAT family N-acetyltransferase [bacterium]
REPGRVHNDPLKGELVIRSYEAQGGTEHFISWESKPNEINQIRETIFGFVRLRISLHACTDIFPELEDCALIRELHVYGNTIKVDNENNQPSVSSQHLGIGKALMMKAKDIAKDAGFTKVPTRQAPTIMVKIMSLFDREARGSAPILGKKVTLKNQETFDILEWKPTPIEKSIVDMANAIAN